MIIVTVTVTVIVAPPRHVAGGQVGALPVLYVCVYIYIYMFCASYD